MSAATGHAHDGTHLGPQYRNMMAQILSMNLPLIDIAPSAPTDKPDRKGRGFASVPATTRSDSYGPKTSRTAEVRLHRGSDRPHVPGLKVACDQIDAVVFGPSAPSCALPSGGTVHRLEAVFVSSFTNRQQCRREPVGTKDKLQPRIERAGISVPLADGRRREQPCRCRFVHECGILLVVPPDREHAAMGLVEYRTTGGLLIDPAALRPRNRFTTVNRPSRQIGDDLVLSFY